MPNVENQDPNEKVEAGVTLQVTDAGSENEAILAIENYLRVNKKEDIEFAIQEGGGEGKYVFKLG